MGSYGNNSYGSSFPDKYGSDDIPSPRTAYGRHAYRRSDDMSDGGVDSGLASANSGRESRFNRRRDSDVFGSSTNNIARSDFKSSIGGGAAAAGGVGYTKNASDSSLDSARTDRSDDAGRRHEPSGFGSSRRDEFSGGSYGNDGGLGGGYGAKGSDTNNKLNKNKKKDEKSFADRMTDKMIDAAADYAKKQF